MKIKKIDLGNRSYEPVRGKTYGDMCMYFFRSPVIIGSENSEVSCKSSSVIIYDSGKAQFFRGSDRRGVSYDMVTFRFSSADKQYAGSINIQFGVPIELRDDFIIASALKSLKLQWEANRRKRSELADLYMRIILIELEANFTSVGVMQRSIPKYKQLRELRDSIYSDPVTVRTVDEECERLGISRTYFHRLYSEAFGVTFRQDIIESRLSYASELLTETDMSVSDVAEQCGYDSDVYFMRQFRKHRGCTPTEYRRRSADEVSNEN